MTSINPAALGCVRCGQEVPEPQRGGARIRRYCSNRCRTAKTEPSPAGMAAALTRAQVLAVVLNRRRAAEARQQLLDVAALVRAFRADQELRTEAMHAIGERLMEQYHLHQVHAADQALSDLRRLVADLQDAGGGEPPVDRRGAHQPQGIQDA